MLRSAEAYAFFRRNHPLTRLSSYASLLGLTAQVRLTVPSTMRFCTYCAAPRLAKRCSETGGRRWLCPNSEDLPVYSWRKRQSMGASSSLLKYIHDKSAEHVFVDETLRQGCSDLKGNSTFRNAFVRYMKSGRWQDSFEWREELPGGPTLWEQFAYRPVCSKDADLDGLNSPSTNSSQSAETQSSRDSGKYMHSIALTPTKELSIMEQSTIFASLSDKMSVSVMILLPMFLYEANMELTVSTTASGKQEEGKIESSKSGKRRRVRDILHGIVAACKEADLLAYLAAPKGDVISDFLSAIARLPVKITVARIDHQRHASPVQYLNFRPDGTDRAMMGLDDIEQDVEGQDLHVLYGNMCAPGTAKQLERALFAGKTFKKNCVLPNDHCKLLAICPFSRHRGDPPAFAVSLESQPFRDPDLFFPTKRHLYFIERNFQQVEELLALMPLLVRG